MTHRRLRGLALLPLAALLCALLVACGGGPSAAGLCEDTPKGEVDAAGLKTPENRDLIEAVTYVRSSVLKYHVTPQDSYRLTLAAWQGASTAARERDVRLASAEGDTSSASTDNDREVILERSLRVLSASIGGKPEAEPIIEATLAAMASSLHDDHTYYLPARYWSDFKRGQISRLGFSTESVPDGLVVTSVLEGSPAAKLLRIGDLVTAFNGASMRPPVAAPIPNNGTVLTFDVIKRGETTVTKIEMKQEPTPWISATMLADGFAYVRVNSFITAVTCESFAAMRRAVDEAVAGVSKENPKGWVLDLRNNGGGYMQTGAYISGRFGLEGTFVTFHSRGGQENRGESLGNSAVGVAPVVVLINARSGSTSEVTAIALQDGAKAYIVGTQSAGAVAGASPLPVNSGAVFITTSFVDSGPKSRRIDKIGVTPDKKVELDLELLRREGRDSQLDAATEYLRQKLGH